MKYISPFSTLGLEAQQENLELKDLRKAKKRLLAEFELHNSTTIELNGRHMDKTAILKIFDQLENEDIARHHLKIYNHPHLLSFLEYSDLTIFHEGFPEDFFDHSDSFTTFIQPYFSDQFNENLTLSVKNHQLDAIKLLTSIHEEIPYDYEGGCYKNSYRYLMGMVKELESIVERRYINAKMVEPFISKKMISLLNALPEYFIDVRIRFGEYLEDIALKFNNQYDSVKLARHILKRGLLIHSNENTRYRLQYVLDQLNFYPESTWGYGNPDAQPRRSSGIKRVSWGVLVVVFIYFIRFISNCADNSTSLNYDLDYLDEDIQQMIQLSIAKRQLVTRLETYHLSNIEPDYTGFEVSPIERGKNTYNSIPDLEKYILNNPEVQPVGYYQHIKNIMPWDALLIINDNNQIVAGFLPAGDEIVLHFEHVNVNLSVYVGKNWLKDFSAVDNFSGVFQDYNNMINDFDLKNIDAFQPYQNASLSKHAYTRLEMDADNKAEMVILNKK